VKKKEKDKKKREQKWVQRTSAQMNRRKKTKRSSGEAISKT
jgi:hypothetical protein